MARGGKRPGAGRKAGSTDLNLRKINVQEIMDRTGTGPDKMPLPFLLAMIHAPEETGIKLSERIQCAIAAAPYCHAKYAAKEEKHETRSTLQTQSDLASALKDLARIARLREKPVIDGDILEASARQDKMSGSIDEQDKMSGVVIEHDDETEDKMSGSGGGG